MFVEGFYAIAGVQIDFPLNTYKTYNKTYSNRGKELLIGRDIFDWGLVFGIGYAWKNFGLDFRYVAGMSELNVDGSATLSQYGFGLNYFF